MRQEDTVGKARRLAADGIGDDNDRRPFLARLVHGGKRIGRLTRLGDRNNESTRADKGIAVAELRGVVHLRRYAGQLLDHKFADKAGMEGGTHPHQNHSLEGCDLPLAERQVVQQYLGRVQEGATPEGIHDGLGLLEDLLEEEVLVASLCRGHRVSGDDDGPLV